MFQQYVVTVLVNTYKELFEVLHVNGIIFQIIYTANVNTCYISVNYTNKLYDK